MPGSTVRWLSREGTTRRASAARVACAGALAIAAAALYPAAAQAHRAPTARERAGIARAVARGVRGRPVRIHIRRIEVSSFGPFATADFSVTFKKGEKPVSASAVLVEAHGHWFETGALDAPNLRPSKPVASDLHLYVAPRNHLHRPNIADGGLSPHTIHVIEIAVGTVIGIFVVISALIAAIAPKKSVSRRLKQPVRALAPWKESEPWTMNCLDCDGTGKKKTKEHCYTCGGHGVVPDGNGGVMLCPRCHNNPATVEKTCETCHGTGKV